jgi:perosamine synthetase
MLARDVDIRLARPELGPEAVTAAARVLESGMLVQGPTVERFERAIAERCGRRHAIAVSNGTAALELAIEALGLRGKRVVVPALTWPSPAHAVLVRGARLVLADVDPSDWNLAVPPLHALDTHDLGAVIAIDQFGVPAHHGALVGVLPAGTPVIEDAACAIGSALSDTPCGGFGVIACLSFHPRKVLTTGEGGMCLTDDELLASRLRRLRNHGQPVAGVFDEASGNHRLTELAAAIGLSQLDALDRTIARRRELADAYRRALEGVVAFQAMPAHARRNEQTFGVLLASKDARDRAITHLAAQRIEAGRLSYALGRLPSLARAERFGALAVSEDVVDRGLALPLHAGLRDEDVARVVAALKECV